MSVRLTPSCARDAAEPSAIAAASPSAKICRVRVIRSLRGVTTPRSSQILLHGFLDGSLRQRGHDRVSSVVGMQAIGGEVFRQQAASVNHVSEVVDVKAGARVAVAPEPLVERENLF